MLWSYEMANPYIKRRVYYERRSNILIRIKLLEEKKKRKSRRCPWEQHHIVDKNMEMFCWSKQWVQRTTTFIKIQNSMYSVAQNKRFSKIDKREVVEDMTALFEHIILRWDVHHLFSRKGRVPLVYGSWVWKKEIGVFALSDISLISVSLVLFSIVFWLITSILFEEKKKHSGLIIWFPN